MAAKYIIFDNNTPFVFPKYIPLLVFHNSILRDKLAVTATSSGWCYYCPRSGWTVYTNTQEMEEIPGVLCKGKQDAEILNRQLFT